MQKYSHFFQTLHDEQDPVGYLGRGTHYSVLRAIVFQDVTGAAIEESAFHDFAVIWDEDHDIRVLQAIERIYLAGALPAFKFIGERKAMLTAILATLATSRTRTEALGNVLRRACYDVHGDSWCPEIISSNSTHFPIIGDADDKVALYLRNIDMLWHLGTKTATEAQHELSCMTRIPTAHLPPPIPVPNTGAP